MSGKDQQRELDRDERRWRRRLLPQAIHARLSCWPVVIARSSRKSVSEKGSPRDRIPVNRGSTRTVMSDDAYELRQKTGETCRGWMQHAGFVYPQSTSRTQTSSEFDDMDTGMKTTSSPFSCGIPINKRILVTGKPIFIATSRTGPHVPFPFPCDRDGGNGKTTYQGFQRRNRS